MIILKADDRFPFLMNKTMNTYPNKYYILKPVQPQMRIYLYCQLIVPNSCSYVLTAHRQTQRRLIFVIRVNCLRLFSNSILGVCSYIALTKKHTTYTFTCQTYFASIYFSEFIANTAMGIHMLDMKLVYKLSHLYYRCSQLTLTELP